MAEKSVEDYFTRPPKLTGMQSFKKFWYDPSTGEVLGRTGSSWAKIGIFYLIFYICLAAFFAGMLWVFFQTIDPNKPRWMTDNGIIGTNPGLGFRPMPPEENVESTLIWFQQGYRGNWQYWKNELVKFFEPYEKKQGKGAHLTQCDYNKWPLQDEACGFDINEINKECQAEENFGYVLGRPCIFLKLNRIYNWVPQYYNMTEIPEKMPKDVRDYIRSKPHEAKTVWVSCEGENPADVENIGPVRYYPRPGFPGYYFPFTNVRGYLSPFVAVQFIEPRSAVLINIECKAWAHNIIHDRKERRGSVHFELLMD